MRSRAAANELVELARTATAAYEERLRAEAALASDADAQRRLGSALGRLASAELLEEELGRCEDGLLAAVISREVARLSAAAVDAILADAGDVPAILAAAHTILELDAGAARRDDDETLRELARRRFATG
jgi:hypothetical protein